MPVFQEFKTSHEFHFACLSGIRILQLVPTAPTQLSPEDLKNLQEQSQKVSHLARRRESAALSQSTSFAWLQAGSFVCLKRQQYAVVFQAQLTFFGVFFLAPSTPRETTSW